VVVTVALLLHMCFNDLHIPLLSFSVFFFLDASPTAEIYSLSLHDALPISAAAVPVVLAALLLLARITCTDLMMMVGAGDPRQQRSEEHTSELQSHLNLVCRLLLEKKKEILQQTKTQN